MPFDDRNKFMWTLERAWLKDSWTWITTAMDNLNKSLTK
jgi:hypothetical protein